MFILILFSFKKYNKVLKWIYDAPIYEIFETLSTQLQKQIPPEKSGVI